MRYNKLHNQSIIKVLSGAAVAVGAVAVTVFAAHTLAPAKDADASTVQATLTSRGYYVELDKAHDVNIDVTTTPAGATETGKDSFLVKTNVPSGYKLYLSMTNSTDYDATHPGNALYLSADPTSSNMIKATSSSTLSKNTWGFNAGVADASQADGTTIADVPTTFSAVPLKPDLTLIQQTSSANEDGVTRDIYYGVNASFGLPAGTYSGQVTYTAMAETTSGDDENIAIVPNSTDSNDGGEQVTITTSLYTTYDLADDDIVATIGGQSCPVVAGSVTVDEDTKTVSFKCTTPGGLSGAQTVAVSIARFGKSYSLSNGYTYPTQAGFWTITYMQEMTDAVCKTVYKPAKTNSSTTQIITTAADYTATADGTTQVPQRTLIDSRDGKSYIVRRLADGECWMTSNLQYELVPNKTAIGSKNDGSTFEWTPIGGCGSNGACAMNGNTLSYTQKNEATGNAESNWYYSWYAATAGVGQSGDANKNIDGSICPANWRLPPNYAGTGGQVAKSYGNLMTAYGISASNHSTSTEYAILDASPLNFSRVGIFGAGSLAGPTDGFFWSSTAYSDSTYAYHLYYTPSLVYPQSYSYKYRGFSVRCVVAL